MKCLFQSDIERSALISPCGLYRYWLSRMWDPAPGSVAFLMLNPSTADAEQDDPTIRRCINFAKAWGYGGILVVNLFAFRATKPADMAKAADPIGPECDKWIVKTCLAAPLTVAAWGTQAVIKKTRRDREVLETLADEEIRVHCLGCTADGSPRHPLFVPGTASPSEYDW